MINRKLMSICHINLFGMILSMLLFEIIIKKHKKIGEKICIEQKI